MAKNHLLYEYLVWPYEICFRPFFLPGIKKTMAFIEGVKHDEIVEVGVGTGYSLPYYPDGTKIVALDLSDAMVEFAQKRADKIKNKEIQVFNALKATEKIEPERFDIVTSYSVITVVPDAQVFLNQLKSFCKPGGHIILVMHSRGSGFIEKIDKTLNVVTKFLFGFTLLRRITDFNLDSLKLIKEEPINKILGYPYSHMIVLEKIK